MKQPAILFIQSSRIKRYILALIIVWTGIIIASLAWNLYIIDATARNLARAEAQSNFNKDLLYRRWNAMQGGVYAPVSEFTPPNPYLEVPEREITTRSGRVLTLVNPAYMLRQVHEFEQEQEGSYGHITSLNPIRPENAPDPWEAEALKLFEQGIAETSSVEELNGQPVMRYMHVLLTEESCLKCHAAQGYKLGDVRGGISITFPMQPY